MQRTGEPFGFLGVGYADGRPRIGGNAAGKVSFTFRMQRFQSFDEMLIEGLEAIGQRF